MEFLCPSPASAVEGLSAAIGEPGLESSVPLCPLIIMEALEERSLPEFWLEALQGSDWPIHHCHPAVLTMGALRRSTGTPFPIGTLSKQSVHPGLWPPLAPCALALSQS